MELGKMCPMYENLLWSRGSSVVDVLYAGSQFKAKNTTKRVIEMKSNIEDIILRGV